VHEEVLAEAQRRVLRAVGPTVSAAGFYLVGGTAVALRLGHRQSVDLDWFRPDPIEDPLALVGELGVGGPRWHVEGLAPGTLHARVDGVAVSLLRYTYPLLAPLLDWPEYGCRLASLEDLGCMKLAAIAQRGAKKDFFDLHALLRAGQTLPQLLQAFARKYSDADPAPVLVGLCYFDDADLDPDPVRLTAPAWATVREEIRQATLSVVGARHPAG
jgi:hypothetical protein